MQTTFPSSRDGAALLVELVILPTLTSLQLEQIDIDVRKATGFSPAPGWLLCQCNSLREHPILACMDWSRLNMLGDEQLVQRGVTDMKAQRRGFWGIPHKLGLRHPAGRNIPPILDAGFMFGRSTSPSSIRGVFERVRDLSLLPSAPQWLSSCADASDKFPPSPAAHGLPSRLPSPKVLGASSSWSTALDSDGFSVD
ncbi:hypothetical protein BOTBODRAFT_41456 [Botryobasidium botryosum FD-172 SS1]|uniref:Uncharacterized protein n=1 Tax=Botryobasidium botryosum (strain FD-172 SS1) TaxID=930990 RepID=A0A067N933_BOTB1|nr:hypothetical protein BOTBODRAFT_41456 [Botryobasidium botryosum FD-172 SS1]